MLEIKKVSKIYQTADLVQKALNDVSIKFRECEFVSILGQSGSGKTTMLNIIGGLDNYTSGDLIINGKSTKKFKDRDWDTYRNHRVGFIFQSYNLITHQTILKNVELALTLSGVSKSEGISRAKKALKEVGLEKHMYKKPNQLSGGQMQRVAIARALINDPDIILADEPTGALDTATSKQIMELLKKVSKDKLVIMVTHNPELAEKYSTRIIRLQDGKITDDSNPFDGKDNNQPKEEKSDKNKKTSMSFKTALGLSLNNLLTKKGRTILTAFAGSIGIIGIALILSLSNGFQNYIDKLQEDTLSSYPLTIAAETMDFSSMMLSMMEASEAENVEKGKVVESQQFASMFSSVTTNDLTSFKKHLQDSEKELKNTVKTITYNYSIDPIIYTKQGKEIFQVNPNSIFNSVFGESSIMSTFSSNSSVFVQYTDAQIEALNEDFKVLEGRWPKEYNEMILVLPNENSIPDILLYLLGLRDQDELNDIMAKVMTGKTVNIDNKPLEFTYQDFLNLEYKMINKTNLYKYNKKYNIYEDMSEDEDYVKKIYDDALELKIVGVVCPKESGSSIMTGGVVYNSKLVEKIIKDASQTDIVKKQLAKEDVDVFSNTKFDSKKKSNIDFQELISVDTQLLQSAFNMNITEDDIKNMTSGYMEEISSSLTTDITPAKDSLNASLKSLAKGVLNYAIKNPTSTMPMGDKTVKVITTNDAARIVKDYLQTEEAKSIFSKLEKEYIIPSNVYETSSSSLLNGLLQSYIASFYATNPSLTTDIKNSTAIIDESIIEPTVTNFMNQTVIIATCEKLAHSMAEAKMKSQVLTKVGELTTKLMTNISSSFNVDSNKIASAFKFNLSEKELSRLMGAMNNTSDANQHSNLINLGYQNFDEPTAISVTFYSFEAKENFLSFIDKYNEDAKKNNEEDKVIRYTDTMGILMSSVKKIVDSVSYVLIAFVSIALIVSSIMIGIITYISVLERTKEIGILRAIGASKKNISSIFNAETFIIGLLSGIIGIGFTLAVIPIINKVIHDLTNNLNINASIPIVAAIILIVLSVILTLIGGLIPSRMASKKDPVEALRTE